MAQRKYPFYVSLISLSLIASATSNAANIERVVVGAHDTFTRLVFHLDDAASYAQTWDSSGRPVITMPDVSAVGPQPNFTQRHAPAVGLTYTLSDDGLDAVIVTDGPVKATSFVLTPDTYGGHRVVIDISRTGSGLVTGSIDSSPTMRRLDPAPATEQPAGELEEITQAVPDSLPEQAALAEPIEPLAPETTSDLEPESLSLPPPLTQVEQPDPPAQTALLTPKEPAPVRTQFSALQTDVCSGTASRLQVDRWDMAALIDHGLCLSNAGRLVDARSVLERILSFDPEFHRARLALADVYARQGEIALAKEAYEYVLLSAPPADVTKRIQLSLRELRPRNTTAAAPLP